MSTLDERRIAGRLKVVYIAHPLGGGIDRERNQLNAAKWCAWAARHMGVAPIADWIVLSSVLDESFRDLGLAVDVALVARCDELWLVGGRISGGMQIEADMARSIGVPVVDATFLGYDVPTGPIPIDSPPHMPPSAEQIGDSLCDDEMRTWSKGPDV